MFPKLNIELTNKTSYINSWNFFSKSLIIKENLEKLKKIILIIDSEKSLNQYKKIFDFLKINYEEIASYSSLTNMVYNNINQVFLVLNFRLKENIVKESQLLHFSQILEKWNSQGINNIIKKLSEIWYEFSEYSNPWTYKKIWDILNIVDFSWKIEYKISFWWDVVEEINIIQKNVGGLPVGTLKLNNLEKIIIWWNKNIFNDEVKKESCLQNYLKNTKNFIILDSLDFSEFYEENIKIFQNFCSFDFVWNKSLKIKDLEIKPLFIENIENLKEILSPPPSPLPCKEGGVFIYTKNIKTITNFIDYNNLDSSKIKITEIKWNFLKSFNHPQPLLSKEGGLTILCDDILGNIFVRKRVKKNISADLDLFLKINIWDYVVHIDHWIWIFKWIIKKKIVKLSKNILK